MKPIAEDGQITALIPIFECADRLPAHINFLRISRPIFSDFVWVVTPGRDESHRLAQEAQRELGGKYLVVPPGLYQAWNAGVREICSEFTYISTVGETASAEGLGRLRTALQDLEADVAFSPPLLPEERRARRQLLRWPIFTFRRDLHDRAGKVLSPLFIAKAQAVAGIFSLLGSCASCLFRTDYLQAHPFPTNFFHYGDSAWVYQNFRQAKFVYLKKPLATFAVHGPLGRTVGSRDVERLRRIILRDLKGNQKAKLAIRSLSRLCAASRYLDEKRGRCPRRFWWLHWKLLYVRLLRAQANNSFCRLIDRLEKIQS